MNFRFIGIKTFRTVLMALFFGAIPLATYYFLWESLNLKQEIHYNELFNKLLPVTILLTIGFIGKGIYFSMEFVEVNTDEKNCTIRINSALRLFFPRKITFRWDEVDSMILDEDMGKTTLFVFLRGSRRFELSYSLLLRGRSDFRAFVSTLGLNTGL